MQYSYEILTAEPKHRYLSVRYFSEGRDDFFKNFNPEDWSSEEALAALIEGFSHVVLWHWEYQENAPETSPLVAGTIKTANSDAPTVLQHPNQAEPPEYDWMTQWIELENEPDENNVLQWVIREYDDAEKEINIRKMRDGLLRETDWMVLSDNLEPPQEWLDYRQALRDVPQQDTFPNAVTWPTKPV